MLIKWKAMLSLGQTLATLKNHILVYQINSYIFHVLFQSSDVYSIVKIKEKVSRCRCRCVLTFDWYYIHFFQYTWDE